jgi:hypothetical protein
MSADGDELLDGLLFGSGEEDLGAAGELEGFGLGAGVADFSVVTDTLGSELEVSISREAGDASGAGLDSS